MYPNMDALRYVLAFSVIVAHFNELAGFHIPWPIPSYTAVGGFFTLSGYLIFGSYDRRPHLRKFLIRRAQRILPPYILIVLICAFCLVAISSFSPWEYFSSTQWWKYLMANLSFLNFLEPTLPGVFEYNPIEAVNGSLWTMKIEWMLYLSVPLVVWICQRVRWNRSKLFIAIYLLSALYKFSLLYLYKQSGEEMYLILSRQVFGQLCYFYAGAFIYFHIEQFRKHSKVLLVIACIIFLFRNYIYGYEQLLEPAVISIFIICASMMGKWGKTLNRIDNVSYDMYLFHFPIIQVSVWSGITNILGAWFGLLWVTTTTLLFALISWHFIGKRFLQGKST